MGERGDYMRKPRVTFKCEMHKDFVFRNQNGFKMEDLLETEMWISLHPMVNDRIILALDDQQSYSLSLNTAKRLHEELGKFIKEIPKSNHAH